MTKHQTVVWQMANLWYNTLKKGRGKSVISYRSSVTNNLSSRAKSRDLFIQPSAIGGFHNSKLKIHNSKLILCGKKRQKMASFGTTLAYFGTTLASFGRSLASFGTTLATKKHQKTAFSILKTQKTKNSLFKKSIRYFISPILV